MFDFKRGPWILTALLEHTCLPRALDVYPDPWLRTTEVKEENILKD